MCNSRDIKLDRNTKNQTIYIHVPYNQSCFYRVETSCGWPGIFLDNIYLDVAAVAVDMTMDNPNS